ncbi:MAG TPA: AbrB/MazE/SpoVT family DNA-binding domain-containing protein [Tepidisphaeraceae bacterium]|nr:AbrB/MazE/SpoVT family DNA-binding domain-containing protein [Tepidisphaeraceae bacterium]
MARVAIAKWGNNLALRLPKAAVQALGAESGTEFELDVRGGALFARPIRKKPNLAELVKKITPRNRHTATDWGKPVGGEVW